MTLELKCNFAYTCFMNRKKFLNDLKMAMALKGLTQADVVREYDIRQDTLSRFMAGKISLKDENVFKLWPLIYGELPTLLTKANPKNNKST